MSMIGFWLIAVVMMAIALVIVILPLLKKRQLVDMDQSQQNVAIARERLHELQLERDNGEISQEQYDRARQDLEQVLLDDIQQGEQPASVSRESNNRVLVITLVIIVPLVSLLLYYQLGAPDVMQQLAEGKGQPVATQANPHEQGGNLPSVEDMLAKLEQRLATNPDDADGWYMLGRTYMSIGNYQKAIPALEKVQRLVGDHPGVLLRLADALAMSQGGGITGKPFELVKRALELAPEDPTGLWLGGMGYAQQGEHRKAIGLWRKLEPKLENDPRSLQEVRSLIARSEQALGEPVPPVAAEQKPAVPVSIAVNVSLDPALKEKVSAGDTVFVFARAVNGPPMPLAIVRKTVSDLPFNAILDDSMAMTPTMKLSTFAEVEVVARISKSGTARAQSGDIESDRQQVKTQHAGELQLKLHRLLP